MSGVYLRACKFRELGDFQKNSNVLLVKFFFKCLNKLKIKNLVEIGAFNAESSHFFAQEESNCAFAIEANPYTFSEKTIQREKENLKTFNLAISNFKGETNFYVPIYEGHEKEFSATNSSLLRNLSVSNYLEICVETDTLDNFVQVQDISGELSLWIDVEGASLKVIQGAEKSFLNKQISAIFIEVENVEFWENGIMFSSLDNLLRKYNFRVLAKDYEYIKQYNVIYVRNDKFNEIFALKVLFDFLLFFTFLRSFRLKKVLKLFFMRLSS